MPFSIFLCCTVDIYRFTATSLCFSVCRYGYACHGTTHVRKSRGNHWKPCCRRCIPSQEKGLEPDRPHNLSLCRVNRPALIADLIDSINSLELLTSRGSKSPGFKFCTKDSFWFG